MDLKSRVRGPRAAVPKALDGELAELAARQEGVFAGWQLFRIGFTQDMIRRRLESGRFYRVFRGTYALVPKVTGRGRLMAAALACGPEAVLSHRAAAAVWDLGPWPSGAIDVTTPVARTSRRGIRVHGAEVERVVHGGFPVTSVARTLVDLAAVLPLARLEEAFERAERLGLFDLQEIEKLRPGRRGARKIRKILSDFTEPEPTRSELERVFRALCKSHSLPLPSQNVAVEGHDVDAYWQDDGVIVELDSFKFHKTRKAFERDRRKAAALEATGYRVLRFTWRQLRREPALVAAAIRTAIRS